LRLVLARADRIFPTSEAYLRRSSFLAPVAGRCRVIPLGIPLDSFFHPDPSRAARFRIAWSGPAHVSPGREVSSVGRTSTRPGAATVHPGAATAGPMTSAARSGVAAARPVILFVGRLRAYKGLPYLLEALRSLEANLVIAGDGPEAGSLQRLVHRMGLVDRVHFAGHVPRELLPAAYQAADVFVLPSHLPSEAFGLVQVEAMASGLPVVCTELGTGTSEVNRHGETGLVVPPADPAALAAALSRLLGDEALRHRLGAAGRRRAEQQYEASVYVARTERAYAETLASPRPGRLDAGLR
jgi:rhamnosyl/mannosyltransferase